MNPRRRLVHSSRPESWQNNKPTKHMKDQTKEPIELNVEELEERIAPSAIGNPGNNNPPHNNTNNPGNEGTGGRVSTGS
jgi:hypothetical protein